MTPLDNVGRYKSPWVENPKQALDYIDGLFSKYIKSYSKDECLYNQGDIGEFVYIVKEGRVRLTILTPEGNEFHTIIGKPGCFFGEYSFIDNNPHDNNAIAIIKSQIYVIPFSEIESLYIKDHFFRSLMINSMVRKARALSNMISTLVSKDAHHRVVTQLINLCYAHGIKTSKGILIDIRFTHEELANITNLSRVSVSNIMSELTKSKIIAKEGKNTIVLNFKELESLLY